MNDEDKSKGNILVVEDDQDCAALIAAVLKGGGYEVRVAYNCEKALEEVKEQIPDLITLDLQMPAYQKKSGLHFYRQVKSSDAYRELPIIVITGVMRDNRAMDNLVRAFIETDHVLPPNAYVDKPFKNQDLLKEVEKALVGRSVSGGC